MEDNPFFTDPFSDDEGGNNTENKEGKENRDGQSVGGGPGQNDPGDAFHSGNREGNNPYGNNPYSGNQGENNPYGNNPYLDNQGGNNPYGNNPYSGSQGGNNPYGFNPYSGSEGKGNGFSGNPYGEQTGPAFDPDAEDDEEARRQRNRVLAVFSLVCGILSLVCCCVGPMGLLAGIPGLIMGIVARVRDKKSGIALAGIIVSAFGLAFSLFATLIIFFTDSFQNIIDSMSSYSDIISPDTGPSDSGSHGGFNPNHDACINIIRIIGRIFVK